MSGAVFPFYILLAGWWASFITVVVIIILGSAISEGYRRGIRLPVISMLIDTAERPSIIEKYPAKGALLFFVGALLSLLLFKFSLDIAAASIMVLALGDSFSTLAGRHFGEHRIFYNNDKSWEGTVVGFAAAFLGALLIIPPLLAFVGAFIGMVAESVPIRLGSSVNLDDNITIPVFSGITMSLASAFMGI